MSLSKLDNTCTCMYLSRLNAIVQIPEQIEKLKKQISSNIANERMWAITATATSADQQTLLRRLGFKQVARYYSHDHGRDVHLYLRGTSVKEFLESKASFFY